MRLVSSLTRSTRPPADASRAWKNVCAAATALQSGYALPSACRRRTILILIDARFSSRLSPRSKPSAMEQSMLDFAENVRETSRLSCQIKIRDDLDGLKVTTPESQH